MNIREYFYNKNTAKKVMKNIKRKVEKVEKNKVGKFIVKTNKGYFLQDEDLTCVNAVKDKTKAKVFTSYEEAKAVKDQYGGKVIRL